METVVDLITAVRDQYGSDRKAAPALNVTQATFSRWRNGDTSLTDDNALRIAELLKRDPAYVLAIVRHDRTQSEIAKKVWRRVAAQFGKAAALAAFVVAPFMSPQDSRAAFDTSAYCAALPCDGERPSNARHEYTLRRNRRRWWQRLAAWLGVAS